MIDPAVPMVTGESEDIEVREMFAEATILRLVRVMKSFSQWMRLWH